MGLEECNVIYEKCCVDDVMDKFSDLSNDGDQIKSLFQLMVSLFYKEKSHFYLENR